MTDGNTVTIQEIVDRWSDPSARPLFKGQLIDDDGCCCAQGDVLRVCGWGDAALRTVQQEKADRAVADALGISRVHAVLLRVVNDRGPGCPQDVLAHPERILGDQAPRVLAFWRRLDAMARAQWAVVGTAVRARPSGGAGAAAKAAGGEVGVVASAAAWDATWDGVGGGAVGGAAAGATNEIQGAEKLTQFYFLPIFGIEHPRALDHG